MTNSYENEIWESLLKAAVIKNSLDELERYSRENTENIAPPASYDHKMQKLAQRLYYKSIVKSSLHYIRKSAALLFTLAGMASVFLLHFDEVRAACHNVIMDVYEEYIQFYFHSDLDSDVTPVKLGYIPEGYTLSEEISGEWEHDITYYNAQGEMLFFSSTPYQYISQADHEHYDICDVEIDRYSGQLLRSTDERFPSMLYWQTETSYCYLQAPLPEEEMIKIAKNVK